MRKRRWSRIRAQLCSVVLQRPSPLSSSSSSSQSKRQRTSIDRLLLLLLLLLFSLFVSSSSWGGRREAFDCSLVRLCDQVDGKKLGERAQAEISRCWSWRRARERETVHSCWWHAKREEEEEEDQKGFVIAMMTMDEFAQVLGISVGVLRYLLCFLASIPCSWLWRYMPNATTRHLYAAVTGALLSYFSFGAISNVYFAMLMLVSYVSMLVSRRHCGSITFVLAFALLVTW